MRPVSTDLSRDCCHIAMAERVLGEKSPRGVERWGVDSKSALVAGSMGIRGLQANINCNQSKESFMTTSQPIELGKASEETKEMGFDVEDSLNHTIGPKVI
jgi:hypothetical protein